jgi:hypothetical protein
MPLCFLQVLYLQTYFYTTTHMVRGLRHEPSSPARTLRSLVRIPLLAWMSVCVYSVFVPSCVQVAALLRADPPSKESYRLSKWSRNCKDVQGSTKGCRDIDRWIDGMVPKLKILQIMLCTADSLSFCIQFNVKPCCNIFKIIFHR